MTLCVPLEKGNRLNYSEVFFPIRRMHFLNSTILDLKRRRADDLLSVAPDTLVLFVLEWELILLFGGVQPGP